MHAVTARQMDAFWLDHHRLRNQPPMTISIPLSSIHSTLQPRTLRYTAHILSCTKRISGNRPLYLRNAVLDALDPLAPSTHSDLAER
jgi:hypothetical protein